MRYGWMAQFLHWVIVVLLVVILLVLKYTELVFTLGAWAFVLSGPIRLLYLWRSGWVVPPRVVTVPHEEDLAALLEDVRNAKVAAHIVVLSLHWGIHFIPRVIADYQPVVARAAFAAGADVIFGHHAHVPKAIGVHGGKVCFYSLSNFIMSSTEKTPAQAKSFEERYSVKLDPDYPRLPYGSDAKRSLIARVIATTGGAEDVSFWPVLIDRDRTVDKVAQIVALPTSLLVDRDGKAKALVTGDACWNSGTALDAVKAFIADGTVMTDELEPCE